MVDLINEFDEDVFCGFVNDKFSGSFSEDRKDIPQTDGYPWESARQLGVVKSLPGPGGSNMPLLIVAAKFPEGAELTERSSRVKQFRFAKEHIDEAMSNPAPGIEGVLSQGLFTFYDEFGNFRLSLVYGKPEGAKLAWSTAKRFSFHVASGQPNKTFSDRIELDWGSFDKLKEAFSVEKLTKEFYKELSEWYFWALSKVRFPDDDKKKNEETRNATMTIRLITRLMFVWFLKHKKLVPDELFSRETADALLDYKDKTGSTYYKAFLQNLFFATLNLPMMGNDRRFVKRESGCAYYRYTRFFKGEKERKHFIELCKNIPFLNGGLFENLDKDVGTDDEVRIDGFSNRRDQENRLAVPDELFFAEEQFVDLSKQYGDSKKKKVRVRGILNILNTYYFTVEENSPQDQDVALDPELLGRVFENLLASYNPETKTTARKETGSFYTPREIVNYMVNESLIAHLKLRLGDVDDSAIESKIRKLLESDKDDNPFGEEDTEKIISAIFECRILDPACGSGAFPMGVLQCMVSILSKLDPDNRHWERLARQQAREETDKAINDSTKVNMEERLAEIGRIFDQNINRPDYARKLYLIENCIFGVDIQPVAVQISKLRFFISLIVEQMPSDDYENNRDIRPLPNLETKFVAANSLIGIDMPDDWTNDPTIVCIENDLREIRRRHFSARTSETKQKYRALDREKRDELREHLVFIANNPDQENIDFYEKEIEKLEQELQRYLGEKWVSKVKETASLFGEDESGEEAVRIDENATKRSEIEKRIKACHKTIEKEKAKADKDAFQKEAEKLAEWDPYDQNGEGEFFDPEWMFNVDDGFDVVIGNPPYGVDLAKGLKNDLDQKYIEHKSRTKNSAIYFIYAANELLTETGINSFVIPKSVCYSSGWQPCANFLLKKLDRIVDLGKAFEKVLLEQVAYIFAKGAERQSFINGINLSETIVETSAVDKNLCKRFNVLLAGQSGSELSLISKIARSCPKLYRDYVKIERGLNWQSKVRKYPGATPIHRGAQLSKYFIEQANDFIDIDNFRKPEYAYQMRPKVMNQLAIAHVKNPKPHFYLQAAVDLSGDKFVFETISCTFAKSSDLNLHFILGFNNSSLFSWMLYKFIYSNAIRSTRYDEEYVGRIPVPNLDVGSQSSIARLVIKILEIKDACNQADTSVLEAEIDQLVYELYELTPEEIAIVKGGADIPVCENKVERKERKQGGKQAGMPVSPSEPELPPSLPGWD